MYDNLLESTFYKIKNLNLNLSIEDYSVVKLVHDYRMYWKPEVVKTLLLAESHVFTERSTTEKRNNLDCSILPNYPRNHVNFVYCLSYGANHILDSDIAKNTGTPQFWKIFNETVDEKYKIVNNDDKNDKLTQKISLLKEMNEAGIWLLDTSIVGIYNKGGKPAAKEYNKILTTSMQSYCTPIIKDIKPQKIVVIGQSVYNSIKKELTSFNIETDWIHQPNARIKNEDRRTYKSIVTSK